MRCARLSSAFTLWDHIRGLFTFAEPKALDEDLAFHRKRQDWLHQCHFFYCRLLPVLRVKKANICCSRWSEFRSWKHESMWCHVHLLEPPDVNWYETLGDWWMLVNCTSHCACCKVWRNRIREKSTFSKAVQRDIWGYWVETDNRNIRQQALDVRKQRYIYLTLFIRIKYANFALHRLEDCCARKTASFHAIQFSTQSLHMVLALPDFTFCTWRNVRSMRDLRLQSISGFNSCFCSLPLGVVLGWGHLESLNWGKIPLSYARLKGPRVPSRCWKVYLSVFNCKWRASLRSTSHCSFAGNLAKTIVRQTIQIEKADEPGKSQECQKMQWGWW